MYIYSSLLLVHSMNFNKSILHHIQKLHLHHTHTYHTLHPSFKCYHPQIVGQLEMEPLDSTVTLNSELYVLVVLVFEHLSTIDEQHVLATLGNVSTIGGLAVSSKLVYGLKPSGILQQITWLYCT